MADMENTALGWDDAIEGQEREFEPVEPGDYSFRVVSMERGFYNGGKNMCACPVAKVEVELTDAPRAAHVFENLYLNRKTMWKIVTFFTAIGLHDKGDDQPFKPDWTRVAGRTGRCRVKNREYNGKVYNEVERWLAPDDAPAQQWYVPPAGAKPMPPAMQAQVNQAVAQAQQAAQAPAMTPGAF